MTDMPALDFLTGSSQVRKRTYWAMIGSTLNCGQLSNSTRDALPAREQHFPHFAHFTHVAGP